MLRYNSRMLRHLAFSMCLQAACLWGLLGTFVVAQPPEEGPPAGSTAGENADRSRGDRRGNRGDRAARGDLGGPRGGSGPGNPAGSNQGGAKPLTKSKVRVGRVGPKSTVIPATLPAQYAARDTNRDGQIGLYEWSRTDLATFSRLDSNRDGFLVPSELANPASGSTVASSAVASSQTVSNSSGSFATAGTAAISKPSTSSGPPVDPRTVAAESAFDFLDKPDATGKKDGALNAEEWERSRNARKMFTDAKVEVVLPLTKAKFVENYVRLSK